MNSMDDLSLKLRARLVDELTARGPLVSAEWQAAFREVPRENFVEWFVVPGPENEIGDNSGHNIGDPDERLAALSAIYADTTLITQFDARGTATSSSSAPSLMAVMLEALDVTEGHTVLEIGTGTGYNAALLSHRIGQSRVFSVDIDAALVDTARTRLGRIGYWPTLAAADGADGLPEHAPYDRIIATCGLTRVPRTWARQVRVGGMIVANVGFSLVRLTVHPDGTAEGPVLAVPAAFMAMRRGAAEVALTARDILDRTRAGGPPRTTELPQCIHDSMAWSIVSLTLPGVRRGGIPAAGYTHIYYDEDTGSWCRAKEDAGGGTVTVTEAGPVRLWDEIRTVLTRWEAAGHPPPERHRIAVNQDGRTRLVMPQAAR